MCQEGIFNPYHLAALMARVSSRSGEGRRTGERMPRGLAPFFLILGQQIIFFA